MRGALEGVSALSRPAGRSAAMITLIWTPKSGNFRSYSGQRSSRMSARASRIIATIARRCAMRASLGSLAPPATSIVPLASLPGPYLLGLASASASSASSAIARHAATTLWRKQATISLAVIGHIADNHRLSVHTGLD